MMKTLLCLTSVLPGPIDWILGCMVSYNSNEAGQPMVEFFITVVSSMCPYLERLLGAYGDK